MEFYLYKMPSAREIMNRYFRKNVTENNLTFLFDGEPTTIGIDVFCISSTPKRPYETVITSGLSEFRQNLPSGIEKYKYAELALALPAGWKMPNSISAPVKHAGPVEYLKAMAKNVLYEQKYFYENHTVERSKEDGPIAGTNFMGGILTSGKHLLPGGNIKVWDGKVEVLQMIPLYKDEIDYALKTSPKKLLKLLKKHNVGFVWNPDRKNLCPGGVPFYD